MVTVNPTKTSLGLLAFISIASAQRHTTIIPIPTNLTTHPLHRDVYGYSIEPVWVNDFIANNMTFTLLHAVTNVLGLPPPIRIGGNTADVTTVLPDGQLNTTAVAIPAPNGAKRLNISRSWFEAWGGYFAEGTNLTYTLNLHENVSDWETARTQAETAWSALGSRLVRFEVGNEVDHYINKGWRNASWGVVDYTTQFRHLTDEIRTAQWYRDAGDAAPAFAAGSFADPPWLPDQQDQLDDMDILNLTSIAGLVNEKRSRNQTGLHIDSYAVHMYPMSTCDPARWLRMRLALLSNHSAVWQNVSQYAPQVEAASNMGGAPLVMGETNSVSCGGRSGISDTLGAALWNVDYVLSLAAIGVEHTYFHLGGMNEYSSWQPRAYTYKGEDLTAGIRPGWYAHFFVAHVVRRLSGDEDSTYGIAALPGANSTDLSGFGVYRTDTGDRQLRKVVLLDMGVWNGTSGLSNPATISAADNVDPEFHSAGARPTSNVTVATPWCAGAGVRVFRLTGPGTNAKSEIRVSGVSFDTTTGAQVGSVANETVVVSEGGEVKFELDMAEAVLLELVDVGRAGCGEGVTPGSGAGRVVVQGALGFLLTFAVGFWLL